MFGTPHVALHVFEIVMFTLGAVAYAVVYAASRSDAHRRRLPGGPSGEAIAAHSVLWCLINVGGNVLTLTGSGPWVGFLVTFAVAAYIYPPLIVSEALAGDPRKHPLVGGIWTVVRVVVWALSVALSAYLLSVYLGVLRIAVSGSFIGLSIGLLFVVAMGVGVLASRLRPPVGAMSPAQRTRWISWLFVFAGLLSLVLVVTSTNLSNGSYLTSLTMRSLPLLFLVAGAYAEGRAAFYDLIVKRMVLTAVAMTILVAAFFLVRPVVASMDIATGTAVAGVLLGPLALAFVSLSRVISSWLDARWLGRHFTPAEAIEHVLVATRATAREEDVIRAGLSAVGDVFDADADLLPEQVPASLPHEAVVTAGPQLAVRVRRRDPSRRFYSEDIGLLQSVARVLGLELDRIGMLQARLADEARARQLDRDRTQAELRALRAQVNPHFLFNALNAIGGWMHADPRRAESVVEQLASVFRYTLRGTRVDWVTLGAELDAVDAYLAVEQARFGTRLATHIRCDDELRQALIPPLVVLTLVENAIKHGVADALGAVRVDVVATSDAAGIRIDVSDTGTALDEHWDQPRDEGGFGLASVRERLRLLCGMSATLDAARDPAAGRTCFTVRLPHRLAEPADVATSHA